MTRIQLAGGAAALLLAAVLGACNPAAPAKPAADTGKIADAVKADADQLIVDYNAHDATKVGSHSTADAVIMFHGQANGTGGATGLAGLKQTFASTPDVKVTLANESTDVASAGDMAVFHSTYSVTFTNPTTKKAIAESGNYLAGYKPQADGSWKQVWSVVSDTGPAPGAAPMAAAAPAKS